MIHANAVHANAAMIPALREAIDKARQIVHQSQHRKSKNELYSWHAPEVSCIGKGKARTPYEFGVKVGIASILIDSQAKKSFVDLGYRGVDKDNPGLAIKHRGKYKRLSERDRIRLKRRQAVEPIIGHLKSDHRMNRCHLKGELGDALHAVLCAAGYNIRWHAGLVLGNI